MGIRWRIDEHHYGTDSSKEQVRGIVEQDSRPAALLSDVSQRNRVALRHSLHPAFGHLTMRAVVLTRTGASNVLELVERERPRAGQGEVVIETAAAALNYADLMQRKGIYDEAAALLTVLGIECSGIIAETGEEVCGWKKGDRVCTLTQGGSYAQFVAVHADLLMPIPEGIDLRDAAALPEAACTVWSNVIDICSLRDGETILVHGGAGGIGSFAIQVAAAWGAKVFATAGSASKLELCQQLGAHRAIFYRDEDFQAVVARETDGHGADVILDNMGAAYLERNIGALAADGRLAIIGLQGGKDVAFSLGDLFARRASLFTTSLRDRPVAEKARIVRGVLNDIWPLVTARKVRPLIDRIFDLEEAARAHEYMESGSHAGKILLTTSAKAN